jgi:penicillin-binding protein 1A
VSPEKKKPAKAPTRTRTVRKKPLNEKHIMGFMFGIASVLTLFLGFLLFSLVALKIPDIRTVAHYQPLQTTSIHDRKGNVVERVFKENRTLVPLSQMSPMLPRAFVAAEDGRFFEHPGLDFISVLRAAINNLRKGRRGQGGSTITQQVAKSLLLSPEKTYMRKFKEAILAWRIDTLLTKDEILYIYLNQIYLGEGANGVEAASQVYFSKKSSELTLGEVAILAGLPQAPSRYNPLKHYDRALKRQRYVLNRMAADGYISKKEAQQAFEKKIVLKKRKDRSYRENGYYTQIVKRQAEKILGTPLAHAGVKIYTNLDSFKQRKAVEAVRNGVRASLARQVFAGQSKRKVPQGALVSMDGCSGRVHALVGGTDYISSPFNRGSSARRPAGSVFKPLIYSVALHDGWRPDSKILDAPLSISSGNGKTWKPKNFSGKYHGMTSLSNALVHSYNTTVIRLLQKVGLNKVHRLAKKVGIHSEMPPDLSLALGAVDVSVLEMTGSYQPFICKGKFTPPSFIRKIESANGEILYENSSPTVQVVAGTVAQKMNVMLQEVIRSGTGKRAKGYSGVSGGKTGTSDDSRDAWFIGFHGRDLTGVWVGHDNNQSLGKNENGGRTAAPIWQEYMKKTVPQKGK